MQRQKGFWPVAGSWKCIGHTTTRRPACVYGRYGFCLWSIRELEDCVPLMHRGRSTWVVLL